MQAIWTNVGVIVAALFVLCLASDAAEPPTIDVQKGTLNGRPFYELTLDELTDILGRPSDVSTNPRGARYRHLGMQFLFADLGPFRQKCVLMMIFVSETHLPGIGTFSAYKGRLSKGIDRNWKAKRIVEEFGKYNPAVAYNDVSGHKVKVIDLAFSKYKVRFAHETTTDFLEMIVLAIHDAVKSDGEKQSAGWLAKFKASPIIPGSGLAGIKLGDPESKIVEMLGEPTEMKPFKSGEKILHYAFLYKQGNVSVGILTTPETRTVKSFRISDKDFNKAGLIPQTSKGPTIGSSMQALVQSFGQPPRTSNDYQCTGVVGDGRAVLFNYTNIWFSVCRGNDLVYMIDIPPPR